MRPLPFRAFRFSLTALACSAAPALLAPSAWAGSWQSNISYGGGMPADLFVPDSPAEAPGLVISLHYCGGTKGNAQGWFMSDADALGFYIIAPQAGGNCFDATAARGGERGEIVAMVEWAIMNHGVDPARVYAAGASSGACMTQALLAAYPEVFAAGSSLAGVPAGAWTGGNAYGFSTPNQSAEAWGDVVRNINPDYSGPWPRMQIWHGEGDTNLTYSSNWPAETGQWTNVWGFTEADGMSEMIQPPGASNNWNRTSYTTSSGILAVETNSAPGVQHDLTGGGLWGDVVRFFAPDMDPPDPDTGGTGGADGAGGTDGVGGASAGGSDGSGGASTGGTSSGAGGTTASGGTGIGGPVSPSAGGTAAGGTTSGAGGSSASGAQPGMTMDEFMDDEGGGCSYGTQGSGGPTPARWAGLLLVLTGLVMRRRRAAS